VLAARKRARHSLAFVVVLLAALYLVVSGTVAMSTDRGCGPGWDVTWRVVPPGWVCTRDLGP
jgi:hypothetical protein